MANINPPLTNESACACDSHSHEDENKSQLQRYAPALVSTLLLAVGLLLDNYIPNKFFDGYIRMFWYIAAYLPVAAPVIKNAYQSIIKKDFFNEFSLMAIATLGAFYIREYPEGVAVMLFYTVGELFQESAVNKARNNIKDMLDMRSDKATVLRDAAYQAISPGEVQIGEIIQVKIGERVALDGILISGESSFDTSALTGESKPKTIRASEQVLAGMLNQGKVIEVKVAKKYSDSSLSRILEMVEEASSRKAKTELAMRKFAKIYTPIVFGLALLLILVPYFFVNDYVFNTWLYRALVFLVISCPCALVISIPLGYFGGIGAASRNGILFKGANYLELMAKVNTIVMDKTGTLTKGVFRVKNVVAADIDETIFLKTVKAIESYSNHPIAKAIAEYRSDVSISGIEIKEVQEIAGHGLKGIVDGQTVLAGNTKLMNRYNVSYNPDADSVVETVVVLAIDNRYAGYISIADELKEDSSTLIKDLHQYGVSKTVMLSGDKDAIVQNVAKELNIDFAQGDLLPEGKLEYVEELKKDKSNVVAFVGDGINDTPVLALSDVGIAMGAMGSDAAIEVADVVIQTDEPSKVITAIKIAKQTKQVITQNIILAFTVKALVLILGAGGIATMWEAVFADVGVALLAILNAVRILRKKY